MYTHDNIEGGPDHEAEALRHQHGVDGDGEELREADHVQRLRGHSVHDHAEYGAWDELERKKTFNWHTIDKKNENDTKITPKYTK